MIRPSSDIVAFIESPESHPERWVIMNVFTRHCIGADTEIFSFLANPDDKDDRIFRVWKIWRFSHVDGLLADPSRFKRDSLSWGPAEKLGAKDLLSLLEDNCILIRDLKAYRKRFSPKTSLLDRQHFGNYHQQLGQQLIALERCDPSSWWLKQKFTADLHAIRQDTLYGAVQDRFLEQWFKKRIKASWEVLDLGCGIGLISSRMAKLGASVTGADPNPEYIRLARENFGMEAKFLTFDPDSLMDLERMPESSFDCIFMSDALLFYFIPYDRTKSPQIQQLIRVIKRLLKPGGVFVSLEPHPVFYLQPWLGDPEHPFTFVTEYQHTHWRINPPLSRLAQPFLSAGFSIVSLEEPGADQNASEVPVRARRFASEFPVWLLVEFRAPDK